MPPTRRHPLSFVHGDAGQATCALPAAAVVLGSGCPFEHTAHWFPKQEIEKHRPERTKAWASSAGSRKTPCGGVASKRPVKPGGNNPNNGRHTYDGSDKRRS
jgi:hypothetical protein